MENRKRKLDSKNVSPLIIKSKKSTKISGVTNDYPDVKVTLKNDALDNMGEYAGVYTQSYDWHGKPSFINAINAIWYNSKNKRWIIGPYTFIESERGDIYTESGSAVYGGLTDDRNLWYYRTSCNEWKVIPKDDIIVELIMPDQQQNPTDPTSSNSYHSQPSQSQSEIATISSKSETKGTGVAKNEQNKKECKGIKKMLKEKDFEKIDIKIKAFESQLTKKTQEFELAQNSLKSLNKNTKRLESKLKKLRQELANKEAQLQADKVQIDNQNKLGLILKTKNDQFEERIASLKEINKELLEYDTESIISDLKAEISLKNDNIQSLEKANLEANAELEKVKDDNQTKIIQIEYYENLRMEKVPEAKKLVQNLKEENTSLNKEINSLENQLEISRGEVDKLKADLEKESNARNIALESQTQTIKRLQKIQHDYENKISRKELDHSSEIASHQKEVEILKASTENFEKNWQTHLSDHLTQQSKLIFELNKVREKLAMKVGELESLETPSKTVQENSQSQNFDLDLKQKYKRLRDVLVMKVFSSESKMEDLETLMNLDVLDLFNKYEQVKNNDKIKIEDTTETLNDVKGKLKLQMEQRAVYERVHSEIMKLLNVHSFDEILPAIKELKKYVEQNEEEHYTNAVDKLS